MRLRIEVVAVDQEVSALLPTWAGSRKALAEKIAADLEPHHVAAFGGPDDARRFCRKWIGLCSR